MAASNTNAGQFNRSRGALRGTTDSSFGDIYWVNGADSNSSSSGGFCSTAPINTLIGAQSLCNAQSNLSNYTDIVRVGPGHAETIVGAAGMTFSTPGVSYIGQGNCRQRPKITFSTSTAAQMIVSGAGILFQNIVFDFTGIDAIVAAISITGVDVRFDLCDFICNNATAGVVKGLLTAATADRFQVTNSRFLGTAANSGTTTTCQIGHESGVDYLIQGNYFSGKMTQAILNVATVLRGNIDSNRIIVSTGTSAITMAAASTPFITSNKMNVASGTTPITAAAGFVAGNSYSSAVGVTAGTASTF